MDEEALTLIGKSKGNPKRKKDGKKNLDMSKVKRFMYHMQGRGRVTLISMDVQRCMSLAGASMRHFS